MKRITNEFLSKLSRGKRAYAVVALCATTAIALPAQTFTSLFSFDFTDGAEPSALVQATNGDLYGTTAVGGAYGSDITGGTVFKIATDGTLTTLYNFCAESGCTDGSLPAAGLVQATNGNFYGTTYFGGANCAAYGGCGTVFKITPSGTLTTLYSFCSQSGCTDGGNSSGALIQVTDGNLYGTAQGGAYGWGTIFKITPNGELTTLYNFCSLANCADGAYPQAGLVQATNGDLYGTTSGASIPPCADGCGTVFKITLSGTLTTLHTFCAQGTSECPDGWSPLAALVQATNGDLYGTTNQGGAYAAGGGTVFKITPSGTLTTLHGFCSLANCADGDQPYAGLVQATNGDLYGTTHGGGAYGLGAIFEITPGGTFTTAYSFCSQGGFPYCSDGEGSQTALVQDTNGTFYGTAGGGADRRQLFLWVDDNYFSLSEI